MNWKQQLDNGSSTVFQTYIDHYQRNFDLSKESVTAFNSDFQYFVAPVGRHNFAWGAGYRFTHQEQPTRFYFQYTPQNRSDHQFDTFLQDKIDLVEDKLSLTLGSKFEHNEYSGFEVQPSARLAWTPSSNHTIWGAISRAVRTPSRAEHDIVLRQSVIQNVGFVALVGNEDFESEDLITYEIGYRTKPTHNTEIDFTTFYNDYTNVRTFERQTAFGDIAVPFGVFNNGSAEGYGFEATGSWDVTSRWQLSSTYSFFTLDTHVKLGSTDTLLKADENKSPKNQFNLRSFLSLPHDVEFDTMLYYVDNVSAFDVAGYTRLDTRLAWKPEDYMELSLVGMNLLDDRHQEFTNIGFLEPSEIRRSAYAKMSLRF
jgi:iron complex outermembrane receptor protein